jgi:adenine phosphoribosyltransferase
MTIGGQGVPPARRAGGERSDPGSSAVSRLIASLTREVPDFPEPGIQFKDLTPLLADAHGLNAVSDALADIARGVDLVAGVDARGFLLGGAVAIKLGIGVLAVRKGGKLPPPVFGETYELEYGTATLEVPAEGIELAGRNIAIIDDVLATGGTVAATAKLLRHAGANVTSAAVVLELPALGGRDVLGPLPVYSLHTI